MCQTVHTDVKDISISMKNVIKLAKQVTLNSSYNSIVITINTSIY